MRVKTSKRKRTQVRYSPRRAIYYPNQLNLYTDDDVEPVDWNTEDGEADIPLTAINTLFQGIALYYGAHVLECGHNNNINNTRFTIIKHPLLMHRDARRRNTRSD